jgi:hypothetical protein
MADDLLMAAPPDRFAIGWFWSFNGRRSAMIHKLKHIHTSITLTCPPSCWLHLRHIALFLLLWAVFCSIGEKVLFVNVAAILHPLCSARSLSMSCSVVSLLYVCLWEHNIEMLARLSVAGSVINEWRAHSGIIIIIPSAHSATVPFK